jgi:hypothetical protein
MLSDFWRITCRILKMAGLFFLLFLAAEFARLFLLFYRFNHLAGFAFLAILALTALSLLVAWLTSSRAPEPLPRPDFTTADHHALVDYCRYLSRILVYLGSNPLLDRQARHAAADAVAYIRDMLRAHPLRDDLLRTIEMMEKERIPAVQLPLKEKAEGEIQLAVLQSMKDEVTAKAEHFSTGKLFLRHLTLTIRVTDQLASVSRLRERLQFTVDALRLSWTADRSEWCQQLQSALASQRVLQRKQALDLTRILWSGWRMMSTGRTAMDRCLHIGLWTPAEAASRLTSQMEDMAVQIRTLFLDHVLNDAKYFFKPDSTPDSWNESVYWSSVHHAVKTAFDSTAAAFKLNAPDHPNPSFLLKPEQERPLIESKEHHGHRHHHRTRMPAFLRIAVTFGQRIKYGFLSRRLYR